MGRMSLGNTFEEKKATYEALTRVSKKWGKVFAIIGGICGFFVGTIFLSASESIILGILLTALFTVGAPIFYYWYGQVLYYGYLVVKSFFADRGIGVGTVAGAVGTSYLVSYVLGGRKAAKKLSMAWLIIVLIALTIGVYAGLYYYIKIQKEAKALGLTTDQSKIKPQNA